MRDPFFLGGERGGWVVVVRYTHIEVASRGAIWGFPTL